MMQNGQPKLPVKQLLILSICRFAEPVVYTSALPYLPEMIESVGVPKNEVAKWVGMSSAVVAGCQCIMAVPWGTFSDRFGRKYAVLMGLTSTMLFSLMFGFSKSLTSLLIARAFLGLMNGNVGIIRTMVAELVPEKELQPRAFSIMPLVWTIGSIFGPAFGGALANPAVKHPDIFGDWKIFRKYPFALPNVLSALFFIIGITTGFLFLEETLQTRRHQRDYGLVLGRLLTQSCSSSRSKPHQYARYDAEAVNERTRLLATETTHDEEENYSTITTKQARVVASSTATTTKTSTITNGNDHNSHKNNARRQSTKPGIRNLKSFFTPQSSLVLLAYGTMALHSMGFDSLFPVFLHHPVQDMIDNPDVDLPFRFTSGLGLDSQTIGILYTLIGVIGMFVQFLFFPAAARRYGVLRCFQIVAILFPVIYLVTPFIALVPPSIRIFTVFLLLMVKLVLVIFSFPCSTILLTNTASSLKILGTLNGVGVSVSAIGRAAGPAIVGSAFTEGVKLGYVVIPWWILTVLAMLAAMPAFLIEESDGFSPDDEDEDEDEDEDGEDVDGVVGDHDDSE